MWNRCLCELTKLWRKTQMSDRRQISLTSENQRAWYSHWKNSPPSCKVLRNGCQVEIDRKHREDSCVILCKTAPDPSQTSYQTASSKTRPITLRAETHQVVWRHLQKLLKCSPRSLTVPLFSFPSLCIKLPLINCQCEFSPRAPKPHFLREAPHLRVIDVSTEILSTHLSPS